MIEKIIDLIKFLLTTTTGWIVMGACFFLSLAITGSLNPFAIFMLIFRSIF